MRVTAFVDTTLQMLAKGYSTVAHEQRIVHTEGMRWFVSSFNCG